ncbi:MAG: RHS repeat-associated core domain-containing protein [Acidobacteriota bacterium]|nr:RHS repeat-associated core domain-containing protein [Acidobacteriota bacterium]
MNISAGLVTWTPESTGTFPAGLHVVDTSGHVTSLHWEIEVSQPGNHRPRLVEAMPAWDVNGQGAAVVHKVAVEGHFKVGRFTQGFEDLSVRLRGISATVNRLYDSFDRCPGDFGIGWKLWDVEVQVSTVLGASWERLEEQTTVDGYPVPRYCIEGLRAHDVLITFPGGETERFEMVPEIENGDGACINITPPDRILPHFVAAAGTTAGLSALDTNDLFFRQIDDGSGPSWQIVTNDFSPWEPTRFELVKDGLVYQIHIEAGLEHITDLEGNRLEFRQEGLFHSSGAALTFERDLEGRITAVTDPEGHATLYQYNATGQLEAVTDRNGHTTRYLYDTLNRLIDIEDPQGDIPLRLFYDGDGRLIAQEDAYGNRTVFDHGIEGREMRVTDRRGHLWVYVYDDRGNVLSATNPLGQITRYTYDAQDRELSKTTNYGTTSEATISYTYDQWDNITRFTDERGHANHFTYDANGNPLTRTDPFGYVRSFTYDAFGRVLILTDERGFVTRFSYPGVTIVQTDPLGNTGTQELDIFGNTAAEIDGRGNRSEFVYDGMSRLIRETSRQTAEDGTVRSVVRQWSYDGEGNERSSTDPLGHVTRKEYDSYGRISAEIDARGNRTEHLYDTAGNKVRTIFPDGTQEFWTYDVAGEIKTHTDPLGRITTYSYDALNRRVQTTYPDGTTTATTYNAQGLVEVTTNGRGHRRTKTYDLAGNRIALEDEEGFVTTYGYDAAGQLTHITNALGHTTRFEYNETGQRTVTIFADGTRVITSWDALGRPDFTEDQLAYRTWFTYLPEDELESVTDPAGAQTRYGYDEQGYQTVLTDALGRQTRFGLDEVGRMTSRTLPLGQRESMGYDAAGNMVLTTDFNAQNRTYQYDARNRQTARIRHDNAEISTTYTATGKRETVTDQRGTTRYSYDLMDRLMSIEYPGGDWIAYGYDEVGNRIEMQTPYGTTRYSYTPRHQIETVTDPSGGITRYAYDEVGNVVWTAYPSGVQTTTDYDALNRVVSITTHGPTGDLLESWNYELDETGRRTAVVSDTGRRVDYTYDSTYRLIQERVTDPIFGDRLFTHDYDANGNRTSRGIDGVTTLYDYDANDRLIAAGNTSFTYDHNGNTLSQSKDGQVTTYQYDPENRLIEATTPNDVLSFVYDADGIRVSRTDNQGTTDYLIDPNRDYAEVIAEMRGQSAVQITFGTDLIARGQTTYLTDAHGNTTALTDAAGTATHQYRYEAYGDVLAGAPVTPYLFTGEQYDEGLGLTYLRARYYNPEVGRFHTMDSWPGDTTNPITLNKYLYANADPVNGFDPSGLMTLTELMAVVKDHLNGKAQGTAHYRIMVQKARCFVIEEAVGEAIEHGVYLFVESASNLPYTGYTTRDFDTRISEHKHARIERYAQRRVAQIEMSIKNFIPDEFVRSKKDLLQLIEQAVFDETLKDTKGPWQDNVSNRRYPLGQKSRRGLRLRDILKDILTGDCK